MNISRSEKPFITVHVTYDKELEARDRETLADALRRFTLESPTHPVVSFFFPNSGDAVFLNIEGKLTGLETVDQCVIVDLDGTEKETALQELLSALKLTEVPIIDERFPMSQDLFIRLFIPWHISNLIDPVQQWRLSRFKQETERNGYPHGAPCDTEEALDEEVRKYTEQENDTVIGRL
ncbi:MAG TPA: hypothetical protein VN420_04295 [Candidatus Fimivivens sp.]|nr:hypothetical protein [Candidatus Fimivivens sp.]